jgi:hypothetical protein
VECATKDSGRIKTLRYSLCDNTPNAATVAVMTGGISLLICKKFLFCFHTPLSSDTPPVVTATMVAVGVFSHGLCSNLSNIKAS